MGTGELDLSQSINPGDTIDSITFEPVSMRHLNSIGKPPALPGDS